MSENNTTGACVKNDMGHLLPYTVAATVSQCEEKAKQLWPDGLWNKLKSFGCKIVKVTITEIGEDNEQDRKTGKT